MGQRPDAGNTTLADKLNHLFKTVRPRGSDREFRLQEVSQALHAAGSKVSDSYLSALRTGKQVNPSMAVLDGLARFFGVPPAYFFDDAVTETIVEELALLTALRDSQVHALALRAFDLDNDGRALLMQIAETMSQQQRRRPRTAASPPSDVTKGEEPLPDTSAVSAKDGSSGKRPPARKTTPRRSPSR